MNDSPAADSYDSRIDSALREYLERIDRGEAIDREEFVARHPEIADQLRSFIESEEQVRKIAGSQLGRDRGDQPTQSFALTGQETILPHGLPIGTDVGNGIGLKQAFGRYRIIKTLGRGAMGAVYLAEDTQLQRQVALKTPHFVSEPTPELLERFYREARAAATLRHPNICPVHDVGQIEGTHYITMAYIEGHPLSAFIQPSKPQPERQILFLVRKLAQALEEAHEHGIVHRDLKPANIMVDKRSEPIIMDFGLARQLERDGSIRITQSGMLLGTPAYMSPEQVEGEPDKIGPPTDQYSLGVILYELLTGQLPFRGSIAAVMGQIVMKEAAPPSRLRRGLDPRIDAACLKMMAKKPSERYGSMAAVAAELETILRNPAAKAAQEEASTKAPAAGVPQVRAPKPLTEKDLASLEELARKCLARHDYDQVIQIVERIPDEQRNEAARLLLEEAREKADEIDFLLCEIDEAVRLGDRPAALRKADELLQLKPSNFRAREVREKFAPSGKGGALARGPSSQVTRPWNDGGWIPWSVLAFGLAVFAVMTAYVGHYLSGKGQDRKPDVTSAADSDSVAKEENKIGPAPEVEKSPVVEAPAIAKRVASQKNSGAGRDKLQAAMIQPGVLDAKPVGASLRRGPSKPAETNAPNKSPLAPVLMASTAGREAKAQTAAGVHGLRATYFRGEAFEEKILERIDPEIDFLWIDRAPDTAVPGAHFSARWEGWLKAPAPGDYLLFVVSDDGVRVSLDGKRVIDGWQPQIATAYTAHVKLTDQPGRMVVEYFQAGSTALVTLRWSLLKSGRFPQPISRDSFFLTKEAALAAVVPAPGNVDETRGLKVESYRDRNFTRKHQSGILLNPVDQIVGHQLAPRVERMSGWLKPPTPGRYRLVVIYDDGLRFWLDGKPLLREWQPKTGPFRFDTEWEFADLRPVPVRIEHFATTHSAGVFSIRWIPPGGDAPERIPPDAWLHTLDSDQASHPDALLPATGPHGDVGTTAQSPEAEPRTWFELDGVNGCWCSDEKHPAFAKIAQIRDAGKEKVKCVAFAPNGDWVVLYGRNGIWSSNAEWLAYRELKRMQKENGELKSIAFTPNGGFSIIWNFNGYRCEGVPAEAFNKFKTLVEHKIELRSISFGPKGSWVLLFGKRDVAYGGVPSDLAKVLDDAVKHGDTVRCVTFAFDDWLCLTSRGFFTSNENLAVSKVVAENYKRARFPKWVSVDPSAKHAAAAEPTAQTAQPRPAAPAAPRGSGL
jgi:serine/threonine protein kinase